MILKAFRVKTRGGSRGRLQDHLWRGDENETVNVLRGTEQDVADAFLDARRLSREYAVRHWIIAPGQAVGTDAMLAVVDRLGAEFGFDPETAVVIEHRKSRVSDTAFDRHLHALVPEADPGTGKGLSSAHSFPRQEKVARLCEHGWGHPFVHGAHHKAVLAALRRDGHGDAANALDQAFPEPGTVPRQAFTHSAHHQARRLGIDLPAAREAVAVAWRSTDTRSNFELAIGRHGLFIDAATKAGVLKVVTRDGDFVGSLARLTKSRKVDVLSRMGKQDDQPVNAIDDGSDRRNVATSPQNDHRTGDPQEHREHPAATGAAEGLGRPSPGFGARGQSGHDDPRPVAQRPDQPGGTSDEHRRASFPDGPTQPRTGVEGGRERLSLGNQALEIGMVISLHRPAHISNLCDLVHQSRKLTCPNEEHARDALVQLRDNAAYARVMAQSATLAEPEDLKAARAALERAEKAAAPFRAAVTPAIVELKCHLFSAPPKSGWRGLMAWMTGAAERHQRIGTDLKGRKAKAEADMEAANLVSSKAERRLATLISVHTVADRAFRQGWEAEAKGAPERIAAIEAALELLFQRPDLGRMGPSGLLKMGYRIAGSRNQLKPGQDVTDDEPLTVRAFGGR
ncbi:hypothetical protein G3T14_11730 [Methylobacterium sp. BTF04]|uniref:hypothetical protein n=1 Tax=Methylobacterium sp. BTF04 TaxID=2708300 RepID=UPI0013D87E69|nr:hypothetical protein [Methylobacterium sp. BTF04]NEU12802.1 hypothetical protein [Methylobacterium sp. BTF04]